MEAPTRFQAILFLLLKLEPAYVPHHSHIVINNAAYQLPLAVVTIEAAEESDL